MISGLFEARGRGMPWQTNQKDGAVSADRHQATGGRGASQSPLGTTEGQNLNGCAYQIQFFASPNRPLA